MPKEQKKLKVEVVNPKTKEEWDETIQRINEFLKIKYTKKDSQSTCKERESL